MTLDVRLPPGYRNPLCLEFVGTTISVYPYPQEPGRNVDILAKLLTETEAFRYFWIDENPDWRGKDIWLTTSILRAMWSGISSLRIADWMPESGSWGGRSDNRLILVSYKGQDVVEVAEWMVVFLRENGHPTAMYEKVSDGSVDVLCETLFVSCKINVMPSA